MIGQGAGGGPLETDLSCYIIKKVSAPWSEGCVALEGGSGVGALTELLTTQPAAFVDFGLPSHHDASENAFYVLELIRSFVISHAHLDHVAALCLAAGSSERCKTIFGTPRTIANLEHIFDGGVWPRLATFSEATATAYVYKAIEPGLCQLPVGAGINVRAMPISHGRLPNDVYDSTAFFVSADSSERCFLFFGDVEPDSVSARPLNRPVWAEAARLFNAGLLSAVFIECSYTSSRAKDLLFGHLSPPHLLDELTTFARILDAGLSSRPLRGLTIYVTHIKRTPGALDQIKDQLARIQGERDLGVTFVVVEKGMRLQV